MEQLTIPSYEIDIFWSDEDDAYVAVVPDLPYCSAWGETYEEALSQVQDAIRGHIKVAQKYGDPFPEPRPPRQIDGSDLPRQTEAADRSDITGSPQDASFSYETYLRDLADQQRAFQDLFQRSANAYTNYLNSAVSFYQQALQQATQVAQSNLQSAGQVAQSSVQAAQQGTQAFANQVGQESAATAEQTGQGSADDDGLVSEQTTPVPPER